MKKTLFAVAVLGVSVAANAAETTTVTVPNITPFGYAPVVVPAVDQESMKAWMEMNQKAHESFLAYQKQAMEAQRQARENMPEYLRIPAIPEVPSFDTAQFQAMTAEADRMRAEFQKEMESQMQGFQPSMSNPTVDIERVLSERQKALDEAVAEVQKRTDETAKSL